MKMAEPRAAMTEKHAYVVAEVLATAARAKPTPGAWKFEPGSVHQSASARIPGAAPHPGTFDLEADRARIVDTQASANLTKGQTVLAVEANGLTDVHVLQLTFATRFVRYFRRPAMLFQSWFARRPVGFAFPRLKNLHRDRPDVFIPAALVSTEDLNLKSPFPQLTFLFFDERGGDSGPGPYILPDL